LALVLSACTTTQHLLIDYPLPPAKLLEKPKELEKIPDGTTDLESVTRIIIRNYAIFQREALKLELLQDWNRTLHDISKGVNNERRN
jgi:hypothetical protein